MKTIKIIDENIDSSYKNTNEAFEKMKSECDFRWIEQNKGPIPEEFPEYFVREVLDSLGEEIKNYKGWKELIYINPYEEVDLDEAWKDYKPIVKSYTLEEYKEINNKHEDKKD